MQSKPDAEMFTILRGLWQGWFTIYHNGRSLGQWHGYDAKSALYAMLQSGHRDMCTSLPGRAAADDAMPPDQGYSIP